MEQIRFQRILFATDLSPASRAALPYVAAIARHFGSLVYLAYVIPPEAYSLIPPSERDSALEKLHGVIESEMAGMSAAPLLKGLSHEVLIDHGDVWPTLSAMLEQYDVNAIVIGSHGRRGVEKLLLGSTAEEILRLSHIPVLMVGPQASIVPEAEAPPHRILYATDFSAESEPAMHYAYFLAKEYRASLVFLHIAEDVWKEPLSTRMRAADFFRMRMLEKHWALKEGGVRPEFQVDFGPPAERILESGTTLGIDLLVLGVRGTRYPKVAAHLPGPTAYDVVSHARCPVLVVRGRVQSGE